MSDIANDLQCCGANYLISRTTNLKGTYTLKSTIPVATKLGICNDL